MLGFLYALDIASIKQIKDGLPSTIDYGKLAFVMTLLEITYGHEDDSSSQLNAQDCSAGPEKVRYVSS